MKIISENKIHELLKEKKINRESYNKSFSPLTKLDEKTVEEKRLEAISKQTVAIEKLSSLLEKSLVPKQEIVPLPIPPIVPKDLSIKDVGMVFKESLDKMASLLREQRSVEPQIQKKWKFNIRRDMQGRIESVEADESGE